MSDQAAQLRELVRCQAPPVPKHCLSRVAIAGGKGGVGTTTVAVRLAMALADRLARVALVDANLDRADAAMMCGLASHPNVADVLEGRRPLSTILQPGPSGLLVAAGPWSNEFSNGSLSSAHRLLQGLDELAGVADLVIIDAGRGNERSSAGAYQSAERLVVVTAADSLSVLDTYRFIKTELADNDSREIYCVVNQADDAAMAREVHGRIAHASRRFLGFPLRWGGWIPGDPSLQHVGREPTAAVHLAPATTRAFAKLADLLLGPRHSARGLVGRVVDPTLASDPSPAADDMTAAPLS